MSLSLIISLEYKHEVTSIQNPLINHQHHEELSVQKTQMVMFNHKSDNGYKYINSEIALNKKGNLFSFHFNFCILINLVCIV